MELVIKILGTFSQNGYNNKNQVLFGLDSVPQEEGEGLWEIKLHIGLHYRYC